MLQDPTGGEMETLKVKITSFRNRISERRNTTRESSVSSETTLSLFPNSSLKKVLINLMALGQTDGVTVTPSFRNNLTMLTTKRSDPMFTTL